LIGAWPFGWDGEGEEKVSVFTQRVVAYMQKATREAKLETSWTAPDQVYDASLVRFVEGALWDSQFRLKVRDLCSELGIHAAVNGLAKSLLRLCSPGVPDTYQGAELWNQSLVDPDNRRPVEYEQRRSLLDDIDTASSRRELIDELLRTWSTGGVKLFATNVALKLRQRLREVFLRGDYAALPAGAHAVAFSRTLAPSAVIVAVPRLTLRLTKGRHQWPLGEVWGDTSIVVPPGTYRDAFTERELHADGALRLAECFRDFPLALLVSEAPEAIE